jgi:hypothetical protein
METKFTKGPWAAREIDPDDPDWGAHEIWPETVDGEQGPVSTMVIGAGNARLIAAAPCLFEALARLESHVRIAPPELDHPNSPLGQARAALSKALGE